MHDWRAAMNVVNEMNVVNKVNEVNVMKKQKMQCSPLKLLKQKAG